MEVLYFILLGIAVVTAGLFVICSNGQKSVLAVALKSLASFSFVVLALGICFLKGSMPLFAMFIVMGLVVSCFGDVILALPHMSGLKNRASNLILTGGLYFAAAHVCYLTGMILYFGFVWWSIFIAVGLGMIFFIANKKLGKLNYGNLDAGMPFYSIFVSCVVAQSMTSIFTDININASAMLIAGFILFWLSDVVLMLIYFGKDPKRIKIRYYFNLSFYYGAQILVASSLMFLI